MARIIVKQPDGKYALWSTVVDDFILLNATPEEIANLLIEEETEKIREYVNRCIDNITREGDNTNATFNSRMEIVEIQHGKKRANEILKDISK